MKGIDRWTRIFKATTWEELKMLATKDKNTEQAVSTIWQLTKDDMIRDQIQRREDDIREYNSVMRQFKEMKEMEKKLADWEEIRASWEEKEASWEEKRASWEKEKAELLERIAELEAEKGNKV